MNDMKRAKDIHIPDPFVLPASAEKSYYLFGATDAGARTGRTAVESVINL